MRKHIRIENPVSGLGWTSRQKAKRFVASGVADWVKFGESIRFNRAGDHQTCSVRAVVTETQCGYDRASGLGQAGFKELANLPMVAPAVFLGFGKRKGASRSTFTNTQGF